MGPHRQPPAARENPMTENEAVEIANGLAAARGWTWIEPAPVRKKRRRLQFLEDVDERDV